MPVSVEVVEILSDARGCVLEPIAPDKISCQRNVHLVITLPGTVRGNHFHRRGTETITVMGPALVRFRECDAVEDIMVRMNEARRFVFPPMVAHAIQNTGSHPIILAAFNTSEHDREHPDTFPDVLIPV